RAEQIAEAMTVVQRQLRDAARAYSDLVPLEPKTAHGEHVVCRDRALLFELRIFVSETELQRHVAEACLAQALGVSDLGDVRRALDAELTKELPDFKEVVRVAGLELRAGREQRHAIVAPAIHAFRVGVARIKSIQPVNVELVGLAERIVEREP